MLQGLTLKFDVVGKGANSLKKIKASYNEISKQLKKPLRPRLIIDKSLKKFSNYSTEVFDKAQKKANTLSSTFKKLAGVLGAGLTIKTAFEGASKMEQYRNTLETVLKDSKLAQKKLAWASRLANRTPFETEEVVGGMTKLQSYGMEGDRVLKSTGRTYIEMIGDMASAMDKPFEQAVEALADSRTGELERLKEFGITKDMIGDFGKQKGYGELFNNKGQIKDLQLFNKALFELMNSKFGGAMEKQSKTFKGAISTIRGVTKSALATFAGIDEFGDIVKNSPFEMIKDKVLIPSANILIKYQEDGTFTKWAEELATAMSNVLDLGIKVFKFLKKWKEIMIPLASALAGLFIINKVAYAIGALKVAIAALSFNPIVLGIGLVIAAAVALHRNWAKIAPFFKGIINFYQKLKKMTGIFNFLIPGETIFEVIKSFWEVWDSNLSIIDNLKNGFNNLFKTILNGPKWGISEIQGFFNWVKNGSKELWNTVSGYSEIFSFLIPGQAIFEVIKSFWEVWDSNLSIIDNLKNGFNNFFSFLENKIKTAVESFKKLGEKISNLSPLKKLKSFFNFGKSEDDKDAKDAIDGTHATGLAYVPRDNYIAKLHEGERVLTKTANKDYSQARASSSKRSVYNINITVNGVNGNIDWDKVGELIVKKIKENDEEKEIALGLI